MNKLATLTAASALTVGLLAAASLPAYAVDPPEAFDDFATVEPTGQTTAILDSGATSVLANDTDVEGGLTVSEVDGVAGDVGVPVAGTFGSLTLTSTGTFTYTHTGGEGTDSFDYTVLGSGGSDEGKISIKVNEVTVHCVPDVNIDFDSSTECGDAHAAIMDAIDHADADSNESVLVGPGMYNKIEVNKSGLVLIGLKGTTLGSCIEDPPTQPCVDAGGNALGAIRIIASGVTVKGFKVTDTVMTGVGDGIHVVVGAAAVTLRKNTAFDLGGDGIRLAGGTGTNIIDGNNMHDNEGDGLHVVMPGGESDLYTISDNKAHGNGGDGFEFSGDSADDGRTIVNENRARDNVGCGFKGNATYGTGPLRNRASKNFVNFCADFPSGETGSIKGRVTDQFEATLEFVVVTAAKDGFTDTDTTSGNGRYRIRKIPAGGGYSLTATVEGCDQGGPATVTIFADDTITVDIPMVCS